MGSENIFKCANPFLAFMKFFGLFPKTLNAKNKFETKARDVAIIFCVIVFIVGLETCSLFEFFIYDIGSEILRKVWTFTEILAVILHLLLVSHQLWKCNEVAKIITSIHEIDLKVIQLFRV